MNLGAVRLSWNPNTEPDLSGYKIYYGTASGVYTTVVDVGNVTTYVLDIEIEGYVYFAITAYNTSGLESAFSSELVGLFIRQNAAPRSSPQIIFRLRHR